MVNIFKRFISSLYDIFLFKSCEKVTATLVYGIKETCSISVLIGSLCDRMITWKKSSSYFHLIFCMNVTFFWKAWC